MHYTFLRSDQEPVRFPSPYAETLDLVAGAEYDPGEVLEKITEFDTKAAVSKEDLIKAWGVRRKGRARGDSNSRPADLKGRDQVF
jgi:hypothetical protein